MTYRLAEPDDKRQPAVGTVCLLLTVCALVIGFIAGMLCVGYNDSDGAPVADAAPAPIVATASPQPTDPLNGRIVTLLEQMNATATPYPTPKPTATGQATADPRMNDCDRITPTAGQPCVKPPAPTPTATVMARCPDALPGEWCLWTEEGPE